jgi:hypothetical protein
LWRRCIMLRHPSLATDQRVVVPPVEILHNPLHLAVEQQFHVVLALFKVPRLKDQNSSRRGADPFSR